MRRSIVLSALVAISLVCAVDAPAKPSRESVQTRSTLGRIVPSVDFANVTFQDAIVFLQDLTGANLHVNWKAIEATGVAKDTVISMKLRHVSLRRVLGLLLTEAAGGDTLTFYVDDGVIEVTTREIADGKMITVVYPVHDLLVEPPNLDMMPTFMGGGMGGYGGSGSYGGGGYGGSGSYGRGGGYGSSGGTYGRYSGRTSSRNSGGYGSGGYGAGASGGRYGSSTSGTTTGGAGGLGSGDPAKDKGQELLDLIIETVFPDMWTQNGGKCSIRFFNGHLVVTAPRSVHEAIGGPLE